MTIDGLCLASFPPFLKSLLPASFPGYSHSPPFPLPLFSLTSSDQRTIFSLFSGSFSGGGGPPPCLKRNSIRPEEASSPPLLPQVLLPLSFFLQEGAVPPPLFFPGVFPQKNIQMSSSDVPRRTPTPFLYRSCGRLRGLPSRLLCRARRGGFLFSNVLT